MIEKKTAEEKLTEILDLAESAKLIENKQDIIPVKEVKIKRKDQVRQDFDSARKNMKELINKGFESLDGIMRVAEAGDSPRAYEVASILIKTISEVNTDLMNIHKTTADALGTNKVVKNTTNNSIFVGSTRDLQNIINQSRSQLKAIPTEDTENDRLKKDGYLGNPNLKPVGIQQQFTPEQVQEYIKCANDPVYFVEKYVKIVAVDKGLVSFEMYDFQKDLIGKLHQNRFVIGKLPRQVGKTTTVGAYLLHYVLFNQNMNVAILANKQSTAIEILGRIKMAYEYLPKWLQQGVIEWNKGSIVLENGSRILAAATSSSAIRGGSFNCILLDEFAHIPTQIAEEFFTSVYPTITSGQSTKMFIISTPNGLNMFYYYWKGAINNQNGYVPFEVHWSQVPKYPGGALRDEQWKKEMISKTSEKQFEQEFECDFLGSSNTLISADKLHTLVYTKPIIRTKDGISVYEEPVRKDPDKENSYDHIYFITADVAEGQGKDYTALTVIDVTKFPYRVVAVYRNNTVSPLLFASVLKTIARKYNNAYVLVEINSIGFEVANILHTDLEYENIVKTAMMGRKGQIITEGFGAVKKVQMGVKTSVLTKKVGCQVLKNMIEEDKLIVEDSEVISEFTTFISKKQSFEAEEGHNDDLVMCLVLFAWATRQQYFKNLTDMDVRLAMYQKDIDEIEDNMLPFGYYSDGIFDEDDIKEDKNWSKSGDDWLIFDKINVPSPWDDIKKLKRN